MIEDVELSVEDVELTIEEELSDILADLVSFDENENFLKKLFEKEAGKWADLYSLCPNLNDIEGRIEQVEKMLGNKVWAMWTPYPELEPVQESIFCVISFFVGRFGYFLWSSSAIFNKSNFESKQLATSAIPQ